MRKLLFFAALFLPQLIFAQSNSGIDIMTGISYSYRVLGTASDEPIMQAIIDLRNGREQANGNFCLGVHYNIQLSNQWHLRTGLRFNRVSYFTKLDPAQWPSQHNGAGQHDPTIPSSEDDIPNKISYNHLFIDMAVLLRHSFGAKKWTPFIEFGMVPSYWINHNEDRYFLSNTNKIHLIGVISGGFNHTFNNYEFFLQPALRFHLTKSIKEVPIKEHLYSGGIEVGLRKLFNATAN